MKHPSEPNAEQLRSQHLGTEIPPFVLGFLDNTRTPWHEDPETIQEGLAWGRKKKHLLEWVRSQMIFRLTKVEQECIELYFFKGLNYRQCATLLEINHSSVYRAAKRGIRKLRVAARDRPDLWP